MLCIICPTDAARDDFDLLFNDSANVRKFGSSCAFLHHFQSPVLDFAGCKAIYAAAARCIGVEDPTDTSLGEEVITVKKVSMSLALILLASALAGAQDYPRAETFLGYTYMRANSATNVPAFSANGGSGQLAINFNKWVGFVMDIGAVHNNNIGGFHLDSTFTNYLFGPRLSLRYSRVRPYFNVLFGGVHDGTSG